MDEREMLCHIIEHAVDEVLRYRWRSIERGGIDPRAVARIVVAAVSEELRRAGLKVVPKIPPWPDPEASWSSHGRWTTIGLGPEQISSCRTPAQGRRAKNFLAAAPVCASQRASQRVLTGGPTGRTR